MPVRQGFLWGDRFEAEPAFFEPTPHGTGAFGGTPAGHEDGGHEGRAGHEGGATKMAIFLKNTQIVIFAFYWIFCLANHTTPPSQVK
jgi:hypothetical protein